MTSREKNNLRELVAVLRTFPVEELPDMRVGQKMGHYIGVGWTVLMNRRFVIDAVDQLLEKQ